MTSVWFGSGDIGGLRTNSLFLPREGGPQILRLILCVSSRRLFDEFPTLVKVRLQAVSMLTEEGFHRILMTVVGLFFPRAWVQVVFRWALSGGTGVWALEAHISCEVSPHRHSPPLPPLLPSPTHTHTYTTTPHPPTPAHPTLPHPTPPHPPTPPTQHHPQSF